MTTQSADIDINDSKKLIEDTIESKFNQLLQEIPVILRQQPVSIDKTDYFQLSIIDIYKNTMQTVIDIINDIIKLYETSFSTFNYKRLLPIFLNENRMFYIGIILVILSFIIYFIDGATI